MKNKKYEKMKEDIRMMKSSDELNKEEGKKMHKIKKICLFFNMYKNDYH